MLAEEAALERRRAASAALHHERMMRMARKVAQSFDVESDEVRDHLAAYVYRLVKYAEIQETEDHPTEKWESGVWFLAGALVLVDDLTVRASMHDIMKVFTPHTLLWSAMLISIKVLTDTRISLPYMALVGGFTTADAARFEVKFLDMIKFQSSIAPARHARVLKLLQRAYDPDSVPSSNSNAKVATPAAVAQAAAQAAAGSGLPERSRPRRSVANAHHNGKTCALSGRRMSDVREVGRDPTDDMESSDPTDAFSSSGDILDERLRRNASSSLSLDSTASTTQGGSVVAASAW